MKDIITHNLRRSISLLLPTGNPKQPAQRLRVPTLNTVKQRMETMLKAPVATR